MKRQMAVNESILSKQLKVWCYLIVSAGLLLGCVNRNENSEEVDNAVELSMIVENDGSWTFFSDSVEVSIDRIGISGLWSVNMTANHNDITSVILTVTALGR